MLSVGKQIINSVLKFNKKKIVNKFVWDKYRKSILNIQTYISDLIKIKKNKHFLFYCNIIVM